MLVDSHCHLNYEGLVEDQQAVLERARAAGVGAFLNISTREREWGDVVATAEREPDVWASIGIHPHEADVHPDVETSTLVERKVICGYLAASSHSAPVSCSSKLKSLKG